MGIKQPRLSYHSDVEEGDRTIKKAYNTLVLRIKDKTIGDFGNNGIHLEADDNLKINMKIDGIRGKFVYNMKYNELDNYNVTLILSEQFGERLRAAFPQELVDEVEQRAGIQSIPPAPSGFEMEDLEFDEPEEIEDKPSDNFGMM